MSQFVPDTVHSQTDQGVGTPAHARDLEFGRICQSVCDLAAGVFDMPLAILKLYDGASLDIKAVIGLDADHILDDLSFSQRKLIPGEALLVPDATVDPRYFLEAAVLGGPKLRFYVDMPLVSDGVVLGVLALCESRPRHDFTPARLNLFRQLANSAATTISLAQNLVRGHIAQELDSQRQRLDLIQEMTGVGYWSIDLKTREVTWSKELYAVYGLSPKSYKPRIASLLDIYEPADQQVIIDRFQRAINFGEDFDFNVTVLRRRDKTSRTLRTKGGVERGEDGKALRLRAVVRDMTEGMAGHEDQIRARVAVDDINDAKADFLAHITRELKAPLDSILDHARLLNAQRFDNPDVAGYTHNLLKSAKALQFLVKDTLDVSSLKAAPAPDTDHAHSRQDAVNVAHLVTEVVDQFAATAQGHQTRLSAQFVDFDNPYAEIDAMRLRQILQNLISNACKFTRGGLINITASQVTVDNRIGRDPLKLLRVSVSDTGIGMTEADALSLFTGGDGLTGDRPDNRKSGAGLGLSISKAIVDLLGGQIGVVSRLGEGANFWFEIPVRWADAPAAVVETVAVHAPTRPFRAPVDAIRSHAAFSPQPGRTAPVDDDRINREYLRALLQDMKLNMQ